MRKILLLLTLVSTFAFSAIDECKTDVYFGNGILTIKEDAISNAGILEKAIKQMLGSNFSKKIGKVSYAYNRSNGAIIDLLESLVQKVDGTMLENTHKAAQVASLLAGLMTQKAHDADLEKQETQYKESIKQGHRVLVVAHSQGNLFAREALNTLPSWMRQYWEAVSIATPMNADIKSDTPRINWDNDLVSYLAFGNSGWVDNPVRKIGWDPLRPLIGLSYREHRPNDAYAWKSDVGKKSPKGDWRSSEDYLTYHSMAGLLGGLDHVVHSFRYYMGGPLAERNFFDGSEMSSSKAKTEIMTAIKSQMEKLEKVPSQWKVKAKDDCIGDDCDKKCKLLSCYSVKKWLTHRHEPKEMDALLNRALVYIFNSSGKVYMVDGAYVKATCGGTSISTKPEDDVCFRLEGTDEKIEGKDRPSSMTISKSISPVSTTFWWNKASDVYMSVSMSKSGGSTASVGDVYTMQANGGLRPGSEITSECLEGSGGNDDPISIIARVKTPDDWGINKYEITDPSQLSIGTYGVVVVKEKKKTTIHYPYDSGSDSGSGSGPGPGPGPDRKYDKCDKSKKSCGCVPCEFIVYGMQKTSQYGPIAGGDVTIIRAEDDSRTNPSILYHTTTTSDRDTTKTGIIHIDQDTLSSFDDEEYYIIRVQGGVDVDSDDNFVYDDVPTKNNGTIHAIIKGSDLKEMPFVVNVLTEAIYQVSGDVIGKDYNPSIVANKLNDASINLINTKLDIKNEQTEIDYKDILLWTPATDKYTLMKPYDIYVQPIVDNTYADKQRSQESYDLIYGEYNSSTPILTPLSLNIKTGLPNNTPIAQVSVKNAKPYAEIEIDGEFSQYFKIEDDGLIRIADTDGIIDGGYYDLRMRAMDASGNAGRWAGLLIKVNGEIGIDSHTIPVLKSIDIYPVVENAPQDTIVAKATFESEGHDIVNYEISQDGNFTIDNNGTIKVSQNANIDYEIARSYAIEVTAIDNVGARSIPFMIKVSVINKADTPILPVQITKSIDENSPVGTVLDTVSVLRDGRSSIDGFKIINPNMPFDIDIHGTIRTTEPIDYEHEDSYTFMVVATTDSGNSNRCKITVAVNDIEPEPPKPTIDDISYEVDENATLGSKIGILPITYHSSKIEKIILSGKDAYAFTADSNGTLYLSSTIGLDYEKKKIYNFYAKTFSSLGYSKNAAIAVEVQNISDSPPTLKNIRLRVAENTPSGTIVGHINIASQGEGNITGFKLSGEGTDKFIVDSNGTVSVAQGAVIDYEQKNRYMLNVIASSSIGDSNPATVDIYIKDIVDTSPVIETRSLQIEENATKGTKIGKITVDDIYLQEGNVSYAITHDALNILKIDNNGTVYLEKEGVLDYEKNTTYRFEATATNHYGASDPKSITIDIIDMGTAPVLQPSRFTIPFDREIVSGLDIGAITADDGDSPITSFELDGNGSEYFDITEEGDITLNQVIDISKENQYTLKAKATNKFGASSTVDVNISFASKPTIDAGDDMAVVSSKSFVLTGTIDDRYKEYIKEIKWSSPDTDKIDCIDSNNTQCSVQSGLFVGRYEAVFTIVYNSGYTQSDTVKIEVEADPLDNVIGVLEKPLRGLKQMKLSKDRQRIYAVGDFEGDDILKIIDVSDPKNMEILGSFSAGSYGGGIDFDINQNESKAIIATLRGEVWAVDISDVDNIYSISHRCTDVSTSIYSVRWYKDNLFLAYDSNTWYKPYNKIQIIDVNNMTCYGKEYISKISLEGSIGNLIYLSAQKDLVFFSTGSGIRIFDINKSISIYESNNTSNSTLVDNNETHIVFKGSKKVYEPAWNSYSTKNYLGLLNIADTDNISEIEIAENLKINWYNNRPYSFNDHLISLVENGSSCSIVKTLNVLDLDHNYITNILPIRGKVDIAIEDKNKDILYAYSANGLRAISTQKQNKEADFTYRSDYIYSAFSAEDGYLYQSSPYYGMSTSISDLQNIYNPTVVGTFDIRKSCYPDCGYENPNVLSIDYSRIIEDHMYIVLLPDYWTFDLSDKNQTFSLTLPQKYDDVWRFGQEFAMTSNKKYIYASYQKYDQGKNIKGISALNTETNEQKDFVLSEGYSSFHNFEIDESDQYLYALFDGNLTVYSINGASIVEVSKIENKQIKSFVLTKDRIYAFSRNAIIVYSTKGGGVLNEETVIPLPSVLLSDYPSYSVAISPNHKKLAIDTKYGIRIYQIDGNGYINKDNFKDIYFPTTLINISRIVWIDNVTLSAGRYILKLKE